MREYGCFLGCEPPLDPPDDWGWEAEEDEDEGEDT